MSQIDPQAVYDAVLDEAVGVLQLRGHKRIRKLIGWVLHKPVARLSNLFIEFDRVCAQDGWQAAAVNIRDKLVDEAHVNGEEGIPQTGPLMVVSNHPGVYDILVLSAAIPRDDVKVIASNITFIRCLPNVYEHFILIAPDVDVRMKAVREAQRHLKSGGTLLFFPRGEVEPDPAFAPDPDRELVNWSESVELFLRLIPQTRVIAAASGGMLSKFWFNHPFVKLWKKPARRQKVAEIFQASSQLFGRKTRGIAPTVSFSSPLAIEIENAPKGSLTETVRQAMRVQIGQLKIRVS